MTVPDLPNVPDTRVGTVLKGKYRIDRLLGAGGMGCVYQAQHVETGRRVAIKFVLAEHARRQDVLRRLKDEARALGALDHENIVGIHDIETEGGGSWFLVMDLLRGSDCERLLERGALPLERVLNIALQTCRGLIEAHGAGIVHRDLKPANLFVTTRPDGADLVKILDFGIAKNAEDPDRPKTATGAALGTYYYMSPEQARGAKSVDERTDLYAVGVILYELLTGRRPFTGDTEYEILHGVLYADPTPAERLTPNLPTGLGALIRRTMHKDPACRPQSAAELAGELERFVRTTSRPRPGRTSPLAEPTPPAATSSERTAVAIAPTAGTTAPLAPRTHAPGQLAIPGERKLTTRQVAATAIGGAAIVVVAVVASVSGPSTGGNAMGAETGSTAAAIHSTVVASKSAAAAMPSASTAEPVQAGKRLVGLVASVVPRPVASLANRRPAAPVHVPVRAPAAQATSSARALSQPAFRRIEIDRELEF